MKKFIFLFASLISIFTVTEIYADCSVGASSAYCTSTSYTSTRVYAYTDFYVEPYTDIYFSDNLQAYSTTDGGANISAYSDGSGPTTADGSTWSKGAGGDAPQTVTDTNVHWVTGDYGYISLYTDATDGYAHLSVTW